MPDTTTSPSTTAKLTAEALGTFLLVFGSIGAALFAAEYGMSASGAPLGIGALGVSLAFGLTLTAAIYAWGAISGGHFNPAVTVGLAAAGRFRWKDAPAYIIAQLVGGVVATTLLVLIGLFGPSDWLAAAQDGGFASNGFGEHSPGGFGLGAAIIAEVLFTAVFVLVILGATQATHGNGNMAPLAIGLTLLFIHLATIPIDNTSVNPARSIATAIYGGVDALIQLWVFIVFPLVGGLLAGMLHRALFEPRVPPPLQAEARVR